MWHVGIEGLEKAHESMDGSESVEQATGPSSIQVQEMAHENMVDRMLGAPGTVLESMEACSERRMEAAWNGGDYSKAMATAPWTWLPILLRQQLD